MDYVDYKPQLGFQVLTVQGTWPQGDNVVMYGRNTQSNKFSDSKRDQAVMCIVNCRGGAL